MSDGKGTNSDPSMDDILSSIRKIISDDEARAQAGGKATVANQPPPPPANEGKPLATGRVGTSSRDDILLLTDLIEDPKGDAPPPRPAATPIPLPRIDPVKASEMPQPSVEPASDQPLVGSNVIGATSSALERLSQAVQDSGAPPATPDPGPQLGAGGKTIEDMVKEMLRPMLKEWLDKNLPSIVERLVEREISRLSRR